MREQKLRWAWGALMGALGFVVVAWFGWPRPQLVDMTTVAKTPLEVTIDDDGKTEVRHIYTVSAPMAGKVLRISHPGGGPGVSRHVGDQVTINDTVVVMQAMTPGFIDVRSREQIGADVAAADAAVKQAEADVQRLDAALALAHTEFTRSKTLADKHMITAQDFDKAKFEVDNEAAALASAKAQVDVRRSARASMAAQLTNPAGVAARTSSTCCVQIKAPVNGRILRIVQESEAVVPAGTPLMELGDLNDLDITTDVLSSDAVQIAPGSAVRIDGWGGPVLQGSVTRIDPAGFLKVSALGIEEQRVHVIVGLEGSPTLWSRLGHNYGVKVHVVAWSADQVLTVPVGALFRKGDSWAVFVVKKGQAHTALVQTGHRNNRAVEILAGLVPGDRVVLHPSDRIEDGTRVAERETN